MALFVHSCDFKVSLDEKAEEIFNERKKALESLEEKSKVFFEKEDVKEIIVGDTPFAKPTWITLGTDLVFIKSRMTILDRNIVLIGSGGSLEPAMAIYQALIEPFNRARIIPCNSTNPLDESILNIGRESLPCYTTKVFAVSKSGNTLNLIFNVLKYHNTGYKITAITENKPSILKSVIERANIEFIEHTDVGGRFTANQPNTLLPVYCAAGYSSLTHSIDEFVAGLNIMAQNIRPDVPINKNIAKRMALLFYKAELAGYNVIYMPVYSKKLMGLAGITTQQVHETYGKNGKGQTILAVEAPEAHHHSNQRFFDGPKNIVGLTVGVNDYGRDVIADTLGFRHIHITDHGRLGDLNGLSYTDFMQYERLGLYNTAVQQGIPVMDICLERQDGYNVGSFMGLMMGFVIYSAFLRGSRWEDQPAVESSKIATTQMSLHKSSIDQFLNTAEKI